MKVITQKRVVQVIRPEVSHFECDYCGAVCGTKENPRETWYSGSKRKDYCKETCTPSARRREQA